MDVLPGFSLDAEVLIPPATAKILIVDDEPRICSAYRVLLDGEGRQIEVATTGRAAIHRLGHHDIDVVILDLGLPDINGGEVLDWIARNGLTTSVIVLPASSTRVVPCSTRSTLALMRDLISLAASALRPARLRTSLATTAKPRPCSPALAASTAALSARILVWNAMPSMT